MQGNPPTNRANPDSSPDSDPDSDPEVAAFFYENKVQCLRVIDRLQGFLRTLVVLGPNQVSTRQTEDLAEIVANLDALQLTKLVGHLQRMKTLLTTLVETPAAFDQEAYAQLVVQVILYARVFRNFVEKKISDYSLANRILFAEVSAGKVEPGRHRLDCQCVGVEFSRDPEGSVTNILFHFLVAGPGQPHRSWQLYSLDLQAANAALPKDLRMNLKPAKRLATYLARMFVGRTLTAWMVHPSTLLGVRTTASHQLLVDDHLIVKQGSWETSSLETGVSCPDLPTKVPPALHYREWTRLLGDLKDDTTAALLSDADRPFYCFCAPARFGTVSYPSARAEIVVKAFDSHGNPILLALPAPASERTRVERNVRYVVQNDLVPRLLFGKAHVNAYGAVVFAPAFWVFSDEVDTRGVFFTLQDVRAGLAGMELRAMRGVPVSDREAIANVDAAVRTTSKPSGKRAPGGTSEGVDLDFLVDD